VTAASWLISIINRWFDLLFRKDYVDIRLNQIAYNDAGVKSCSFHCTLSVCLFHKIFTSYIYSKFCFRMKKCVPSRMIVVLMRYIRRSFDYIQYIYCTTIINDLYIIMETRVSYSCFSVLLLVKRKNLSHTSDKNIN
jgi:hypothetical protein